MPEQPAIEHRTEERYAGIRRPVTAGVPTVVDKAFPQLFRWSAGRDLEPSGAAFIRTLAVDDEGAPLEVDAAFPLEAEFEPEGAVEAYLLPEGDYLTVRHIGPDTSEDLEDLVDARGRPRGLRRSPGNRHRGAERARNRTTRGG